MVRQLQKCSPPRCLVGEGRRGVFEKQSRQHVRIPPCEHDFLATATDREIVHQPLIQITRTFRPSSALHPTGNPPATNRRHPDLPSRLCARISAGTHAIPVEEAYQTSSAGASMHLVFVGLMIWTSSSTTRQGREKQHLLWENMETRAWTLRPWFRCHLHQSTYQYRCLS